MMFEQLHVVVSDAHGYFRDKKLYKAIFQFIKDIKPSSVNLNGDMIDFYACSSFPHTNKDYDRCEDLAYEIHDFRSFLGEFRDVFPVGNIDYNEGNHEFRLKMHLAKGTAKNLRGLDELKIEKLLQFDKYKINYHEDSYALIPNRFILTHGKRWGANAATLTLKEYMISGSSGHGHGSRIATIKTYNNFLSWYCTGHTADQSQIDYAKGRFWDQSFLLVIETKRNFLCEIIYCNNGKFYCKYNNKEYPYENKNLG